ncbi:caspase family protein [Microcoleus sp. FACHB-672]|uniref:nSTAND1 domain-containing NTPase n=1 Tax=Microcoleus sp. FACHB-672 TaxID=2692825 RepID=UPI001686BB6C|nr:caspase family protein [Microcoleus sp. FACHB-672]MBD2042661.1 caspase family protein [Microcoleus sp. FACHB-672]
MTRYALVVGITDYDGLPSLTKPIRDAEAVAQRLEKHGDFQVERLPKRWNPEKECYEVAQERVTGKQLGRVLLEFLQKQAAGSDALIYFSGHGITVFDELDRQKGYLAASDCTIKMEGKQIVAQQHGVALDSLNYVISQADLSSLVVLLDCCHADYFLEGDSIRKTLSVFTYKPDCHLIAACRSFANVDVARSYGKGYSAFTTALLEGLLPENAGSDGQVSIDELFGFISRKLEDINLHREEGEYQQPIWMSSGRSLSIVSYPPKQTPPAAGETCPYQGLLPFDRTSADFFFGRREVIQMIRQKLEVANFVPVIGASGSGKSSVIQAGLIPLLETSSWRVLEMLPGNEPVAELKRTFSQLLPASDAEKVDSLVDKAPDLDWLMKHLPISERVLLVVDRFEEVFAVCSEPATRNRFIQLLTQVAEISSRQLAIVITMQADFIALCLHEPSLIQLIQDWAVYIPPLVGKDLEQAITAPAILQGYELESGLLETILQDITKEKNYLPLLQFTLTQLWEERDQQSHQLTLNKDRQLGGVLGAIDQYAEQFYQSLTQQEQDWLKRIFLNLVSFGTNIKDIRRRVPKSQLLELAGTNSASRQLISDLLDRLIEANLLVINEDEWVDLAHEALMDKWKRFAKWRLESWRQLQCEVLS